MEHYNNAHFIDKEKVQKMADDHCDWLLKIMREPMVQEFIHGYKHGYEDGYKAKNKPVCKCYKSIKDFDKQTLKDKLKEESEK